MLIDSADIADPGADAEPEPWWRSLPQRAWAWLPEGRSLQEDVWIQRHRTITRFALIQAVAFGLFGLFRGLTVITCVIDVLLVGTPALLARVETASRRLRTVSATVSLMFASAVLVDIAGGSTEAHFHFFVMVGVVAAYQDWVAFGVCILITVLHHAVMGVIAPHAVYGSPAAWHKPVLWALIHGLFVLAASLTHIFAWRTNEQQVLLDPLTGLPNRTAFLEALDRGLSDRSDAVSVLYLDIDNFKAINDSAGHDVGDEALRHTARRVAGAIREGDLVARLAGDEFAVIVRGTAAVAESVGGRILATLEEPLLARGSEIFIQASIGVADDSLARSRDPGDLLRDADLAMYLAKSSGKNQVITYTAGVDEAVRDRAELAADIRHALAAEQFEIHYQPVVTGTSGELSGVEALLRWRHPTRGLIPPTEFIPIAEQTGAIRDIGAWVLRTAGAQVVAWQESIPGCGQLRLSVNLSPLQLSDPSLDAIITNTLLGTGLAASHLTLEVTESMLLADLDLARQQLDAARALGVQVAIDDFGTGYSSLSYLARLPVDQVKIDRSFVKDLHVHSGGTVLVKAIIDMATGLGLDVLAEGVEESGQQRILDQLGCPSSQGYLFSRPLPVDEFAAFASSHADGTPGAPAAPRPDGFDVSDRIVQNT